MTRFDRVRGFLESDVFARVAVLILAVLLCAALGQWRQAQDRADVLGRQRDVARVRLDRVRDGCASDPQGGGVCKPRTFQVPTSTTTTGAR